MTFGRVINLNFNQMTRKPIGDPTFRTRKKTAVSDGGIIRPSRTIKKDEKPNPRSKYFNPDSDDEGDISSEPLPPTENRPSVSQTDVSGQIKSMVKKLETKSAEEARIRLKR